LLTEPTDVLEKGDFRKSQLMLEAIAELKKIKKQSTKVGTLSGTDYLDSALCSQRPGGINCGPVNSENLQVSLFFLLDNNSDLFNKMKELTVSEEKKHLAKIDKGMKLMCKDGGEKLHHFQPLVNKLMEQRLQKEKGNIKNSVEVLRNLQTTHCKMLDDVPFNKSNAGFYAATAGAMLATGLFTPVSMGIALTAGGVVFAGIGYSEYLEKQNYKSQSQSLAEINLEDLQKAREDLSRYRTSLGWTIADGVLLFLDGVPLTAKAFKVLRGSRSGDDMLEIAEDSKLAGGNNRTTSDYPMSANRRRFLNHHGALVKKYVYKKIGPPPSSVKVDYFPQYKKDVYKIGPPPTPVEDRDIVVHYEASGNDQFINSLDEKIPLSSGHPLEITLTNGHKMNAYYANKTYGYFYLYTVKGGFYKVPIDDVQALKIQDVPGLDHYGRYGGVPRDNTNPVIKFKKDAEKTAFAAESKLTYKLKGQDIGDVLPTEYYQENSLRVFDPDDQTIVQGFKLHVSPNIDNAQLVSELLLPHLRKMEVPHKVVESLNKYKTRFMGHELQHGKFIIIYPRSVEEAKTVTREVNRILKRLDFTSKDFVIVPGERNVSSIDAVHARYGVIKAPHKGFNRIARVNFDGYAVDRTGKILLYNGKRLRINRTSPLEKKEIDFLERMGALKFDRRGQNNEPTGFESPFTRGDF